VHARYILARHHSLLDQERIIKQPLKPRAPEGRLAILPGCEPAEPFPGITLPESKTWAASQYVAELVLQTGPVRPLLAQVFAIGSIGYGRDITPEIVYGETIRIGLEFPESNQHFQDNLAGYVFGILERLDDRSSIEATP
jgi:hypothetical protein